MSCHGDRRGQIADFRDSFETISRLVLLFKCGIKTKTHFEWPNGLVGCKVPTDLVKISVKEATHMGFHYKLLLAKWGIHVDESVNLIIIGSDNGLAPDWRQAIIWTTA